MLVGLILNLKNELNLLILQRSIEEAKALYRQALKRDVNVVVMKSYLDPQM